MDENLKIQTFISSKDENGNDEVSNMNILNELVQIIFNLNEQNLESSTQKSINLIKSNFLYSFNFVICNLVYSAFVSHNNFVDLYLNYLQMVQIKEEKINKNNIKIIDVFSHFILGIESQEANYLIEKMIERKQIDSDITKNIISKYFLHYNLEKEIHHEEQTNNAFGWDRTNQIDKSFYDNYEELKKNDWELHKKYVKEGVNPNEITKIIRNDEIEKLQEISSQTNFYFNQKIQPSLYERCSYINHKNVTLIDYAAFFSSVKCFKYLLMNNANVKNTGKYAVAGGNEEIIHLCEQNHSSFHNACQAAIKFHRNDIFKYIYEKKLDESKEQKSNSYLFQRNKLSHAEMKSKFMIKLGETCVKYGNYEILSFLEKEGMKVNDNIINITANTGNLFLVQYFLKNHQAPKDILPYAVKSKNIELAKYILQQKGINVNAKSIFFVLHKFCFVNLIYKNNFRNSY